MNTPLSSSVGYNLATRIVLLSLIHAQHAVIEVEPGASYNPQNSGLFVYNSQSSPNASL